MGHYPGRSFQQAIPRADEPGKYTDSLYWLVFTSDMRDLAWYRVAVHDSIRGTAFMSDVNGHTVINYQAAGQNFIGEFIYENGKLSIYPFEERFTNKILRKMPICA